MPKTLTEHNYFLSEVEGHDDEIAFQFDFEFEGGKALSDHIIEETEEGDLIIEGYAAVFDGLDREGENFAPGAFVRGCKAFLSHSAPLCFHHSKRDVLGKVLALDEDEKGLKMRARVDGAIKKHPTLGVIYEQIKRGTFNGLSVQGFFRRALQEGGPRIVDMDFTEISVTPAPVHTGPRFAVVGGKALTDLEFPASKEHQDDVRAAAEEFDEQMRRLLAEVQKLDPLVTRLTGAVLNPPTEDDNDGDKPTTDDLATNSAPDGAEAVTA
jgi:HK97 family phage prohead protease